MWWKKQFIGVQPSLLLKARLDADEEALDMLFLSRTIRCLLLPGLLVAAAAGRGWKTYIF